jgi:tetratricopeptide (TPR) repeat protein
VLVLGYSLSTFGADVQDGQRLFLSGDYGSCITMARSALADHESEEWQLLLSRALLATGRYPEALKAITNALVKEEWSVRLQWQAREVFLANGQTQAAADIAAKIFRMVASHPRDFEDAPSLVVFGQAALLANGDPKRVLDSVFEAARKADPKCRDVYLASGQLALDKHDFALAAKRFQDGLKQIPDDPDLNVGLARAYEPSDTALMSAAVEAALTRNSNHVGALLLVVAHSIDAEDYQQATNLLDRIQGINPWHPEAWAYRAVLANLQSQPKAEEEARQNALKFWPTNPKVEYLIGLKLSQNYRFTEGSSHQRNALDFDQAYLPSKIQLAQDLLRLGEEAEGWKLAQEVQKQDAYDVEAYNLSTLHDAIRNFATLTNDNFILRLSRHEAAIYGPRALALLERARTNLCAKYGVELKPPTIVEVFPDQKDFAVRTFGMPGNPGYLGVCFGSVVTANSPAAHPGHPINWEDVLWHEFCHCVTLQLTQNKMPRWLSEGISVYEERQANPAWGEHMNPRYRQMTLGDDLQPVSKLSAAFLSPRSSQHLQFAYYESSLVVEFLVQRYGPESLKAILHDLRDGVEINKAIENHSAPMSQFESEFAAFARERALNLAPGLDWEQPELKTARANAGGSTPRKWIPESGHSVSNVVSGEDTAQSWESWARSRPTNFWVMTRQAQDLVEAKQWSEAKPILEKLISLYPDFVGDESAYRMLATAHRALAETNAEREVLTRFAAKDSEALDAYRRLMELDSAVTNWPAVEKTAQRYLAVDPLVALPHKYLAQASEKLDAVQTAIPAYRALLELDPPDPAEVHYHLARLLHQAGSSGEARRQVLQALEEAPRYRDALRLLLKINGGSETGSQNGT